MTKGRFLINSLRQPYAFTEAQWTAIETESGIGVLSADERDEVGGYVAFYLRELSDYLTGVPLAQVSAFNTGFLKAVDGLLECVAVPELPDDPVDAQPARHRRMLRDVHREQLRTACEHIMEGRTAIDTLETLEDSLRAVRKALVRAKPIIANPSIFSSHTPAESLTMFGGQLAHFYTEKFGKGAATVRKDDLEVQSPFVRFAFAIIEQVPRSYKISIPIENLRDRLARLPKGGAKTPSLS
jgi:hypothetical protein